MKRIALLLPCVFLLLTGCPEEAPPPPAGVVDAGGGGGGGGGEEEEYACERDDSALEVLARCSSDDQCPCGAHCALGQCAVDCAADSDCAGGRCDDFGRCYGEDEAPDEIQPPSTEPEGSLQVRPEEIDFLEADTLHELRVMAMGRSISEVQVLAASGLTLRCGDTGGFADRCKLRSVNTDAEQKVQVKVAEPGDHPPREGGRSWSVRFVRAGGERVISLRQAPPLVEPEPRQGRYQGRMRLVGVGDTDPAEPLELPVEANLIEVAEGFHLVLIDRSGTLARPDEASGESRLLVRVADDEQGHPRLTVAERPFLPAERAEGEANPAYYVRGHSDRAAWLGSGLEAELILEVGDAEETHRLRWRLQLNRMRDLDAERADEFTRPREERPADVADDDMPMGRRAQDLRTRLEAAIIAQRRRAEGSRNSLMRCLHPMDYIDCGLNACPQEMGERFDCRPVFEEVCTPGAFCIHVHRCRFNRVNNDPSLDADWRHSTCAQRFLCAREDSIDSSELDVDAAPADGSGDFRCRDDDDPRPRAIPLFNQLDVAEDVQLGREELLRDCLEDLEADLGDDYEAAFARRRCFSRARFAMALHHSVESLLDETPGVVFDNERRRNGALLLHLLGRWIDLHSFMARQTLQAEVLSRAVDRNVVRPPDLDRVADRVRRALDLLLQPRVARAVARIPVAILEAPDHRPLLRDRGLAPDDENVRADHSRALHLRLLGLLAAQHDLDAILLRRAHRGAPAAEQIGALRRVARGLNRALLLEARGHRLARRINRQEAEPFLRARRGLRAARRALLARLHAMREGRNPLGIEDTDLHTVFPADRARNCREASCYFGFSDDLRERAVGAVDAAEAQVDEARAAYAQELNRGLQSRERADQQAEIDRRYGGAILRLCGSCEAEPVEEGRVIERLGAVDADAFAGRCFLRRRAGAVCDRLPEEDDPIRGVTLPDLGYELCLRGQMRRALGPAYSHGDAELDAIVDRIAHLRAEAGDRDLDGLRERAGLAGDEGLALLRRLLRAALRHQSAQAADHLLTARRRAAVICRERWPGNGGGLRPPLHDVDPEAEEEIFQGELGQLATGVLVAAKAVAIQRQRLVDHSERYDIAVRGCRMGLNADEEATDFEASHRDRMEKLHWMKLAIDAGPRLVAGILRDPVAGFSAVLSVGLAERMRAVEEGHAEAVRRRAANARFKRCMNEAKQHLVGLRVAQLAIDRALLEARQRRIQLNDAKGTVARLLREGRLARQRHLDREHERLDHDLWLTERIEAFNRSMERARRYVYLLVRTVEYERQLTSPSRADVLSAATPRQLREVVERLTDADADRRVHGRLPSGPHSLVLSLRDDILGLRDRVEEGDRPGAHRLTAIDAFRRRMAAAEAERDADGNVVAFRIPFVLHPRGGEEPGLLPSSGCGERIMGLTLNLVGRDLHEGLSLEPIQVGKANTFHSQRCGEEGDHRDRFQVQAHRPHRNLVSGEEPQRRPGGVVDWQEIQPVENQSVVAFRDHRAGERETAHGFAGRGLFGRYVLRFPVDTRWRIHHLEDVLLRVDYVSVAR